MSSHPTRLPYGLSYVKPDSTVSTTGFANAVSLLLQNSSSTLFKTPDVSLGTYWIAANSGLITNFINGELGKILYVKCVTGGVVALQNSVGGITFNNIVGTVSNNQIVTVSSTAGNITMLNGEVLHFINDGTGWCLAGSRFVLNTQV